jgi:hypothetical protein
VATARPAHGTWSGREGRRGGVGGRHREKARRHGRRRAEQGEQGGGGGRGAPQHRRGGADREQGQPLGAGLRWWPAAADRLQEPAVQLGPRGLGQPVHPHPLAAVGRLGLDQAVAFQAGQGGVDLPVVERPDLAGGRLELAFRA